MDVAGEDIVCLALRAWDSPWKNNQQVMSRLAETNRVFYVSPPRSLRESVLALRAREPAMPAIEPRGATLLLYHEPRLLVRSRHSEAYNRLTKRLRLIHVRRLAAQLGFAAPILWIYDPMYADALGMFREQLVVYSVIDNYREYIAASHPSLRAAMASNHLRMLKAADVVFTVSETLHAECQEYNRHCYHVPNGVPYKQFRMAAEMDAPPDDITAIPHPRIGYVGVLQSTLDLDLLREVAQRRPDWSVVIVGPTEHADHHEVLAPLRSLPNVHYLGPKKPAEVPVYITACDVALLPYRMSQATAYIDSIKLYEYLACGKPVVATDIPSARRFAHLISIAHGPTEFVTAISTALRNGQEGEGSRVAAAAEHSWDQRVSTMKTILAGRLWERAVRKTVAPAAGMLR